MRKWVTAIAIVLLVLSISRSVFAKVSDATPSSANVVEYVLPYPGILPDHPLFALKAVRDWIFERLITDPQRLSEFHILQSDKRLAMAGMFMDQSKPEGAVAAVSQSEEFMKKAIDTAKKVREREGEVPGHILDRLERSVAKHLLLIEEFSVRGEELHNAAFRASLDAFRSLQSKLPDLH